jgi:hypothetical protein
VHMCTYAVSIFIGLYALLLVFNSLMVTHGRNHSQWI